MQSSRSGVLAILLGVVVCCAAGFSVAGEPAAGQLYAGWATVDITPSARVVLDGSGYKRVTNEVEDPVTAHRNSPFCRPHTLWHQETL